MDEQRITSYSFPVVLPQSLDFAVGGGMIKYATLKVNDALLSTYKPVKQVPGQITGIKFFRDKPFHAGLLERCTIVVTLYAENAEIPSLMMSATSDPITWDNIENEYVDDVWASTPFGEKNLLLVYTRNSCGYKKI